MRVYRYFDTIAVSTPTGATFYLTPEQALTLANALKAGAEDCAFVKFTESKLQPVAIDGVATSTAGLIDQARMSPAQLVR